MVWASRAAAAPASVSAPPPSHSHSLPLPLPHILLCALLALCPRPLRAQEAAGGGVAVAAGTSTDPAAGAAGIGVTYGTTAAADPSYGTATSQPATATAAGKQDASGGKAEGGGGSVQDVTVYYQGVATIITDDSGAKKGSSSSSATTAASGTTAADPPAAKSCAGGTLLVAELKAIATASKAKGLAFVLVNANTKVISFYVADLVGITSPLSVEIGSGVAGVDGTIVATLLTANTYVASTSIGYAFAGVVPITDDIVAGILTDPTSYYAVVLTSDFTSGAVRGQLLTAEATATALPNILFPAYLLKQGLYAALVDPIGATGEDVIVGAGPLYPYLNLTVEVRALAIALPAALGVFSSDYSGVGTTTLTTFLTAIIPALTALSEDQPSVETGELVEAGAAALLATVVGFVGCTPLMSSPKLLAALSGALAGALRVKVTK
eukprot:SM000273S10240  [mRNA]  locus=s273:160194:161867:- [translate_table: standard]